ncbi:MAG: UbiD family decarboxylase [Firmicutes bacterium]|nr:UbiD family decarboxylase [Bacillota bacterium]
MAYRDLREWINRLREMGELLVIDRPVSSDLELGAICRYLLDRGPNRAVLFTAVDGGTVPVLANAFASRRRVNAALEVTEANRMAFVLERWERRIPPREVPPSAAPLLEVEAQGEAVDLSRFPIPRHNPGDGGRYISFGILIVREPESGRHNLSYQRILVRGPRQGLINIEPNKHARRIWEQYRQRGEAMPVAVAIGVDPALNLAAAASPPWEVDEYDLAGAFRGEPVEVVRLPEVPLLVPAQAEIVLVGRVLPDQEELEGPFAEFTGHYGAVVPNPVLEIDRIYHRRHPIYHTLYTGRPVCDNHVIQELLRSGKVWQAVRRVLPNVTAVYCPPQGANGYTVWIALDKRHNGEPKLAMMAAWTAFQYAKHVYVVDSDVDIYDPVQREWVVATRVQADRDVWIIPEMVGHVLDPSAQGEWGAPERLGIAEVPRGTRAVMGIDATRPLGVSFPAVVEVEPEQLDRAQALVEAVVAAHGETKASSAQ